MEHGVDHDLTDKWALVTGASSGFGIDFAHLLAARGARLVLAARRTAPMEALARELAAQYGTVCHVESIDLARSDAPSELKARLDARGIAIDVLINNAGYGLYGDFVGATLQPTLDMLQVNILSVTALTHLFASDMVRRGGGQILLVASIAAYQATPTYAAYSASKAYVLLFGEALHEELRDQGVVVTVLSPGITATGFLDVSGQRPTFYQRIMMMQSRPVAVIGLRALHQRRASVVPGWGNAAGAWLNRLVPRAVQRKVSGLLMKN